MTMTRQHFQLIADALSYAKPSRMVKPQGFGSRVDAWSNTVQTMADMLKTTNPNFDRERFIKACNL